MFQLLQGLVAGTSLSMNLTGNKDGTLTVVVAPKGDGPLSQPLVLTATAAELDAEFHEVVSSYVNARKGLAEQIEATTAVIDAAKKQSAAQAVSAITKSPKAGKPEKGNAPDSSDSDDEDEDADSTGTTAAPATSGAPAEALVDNLFA